MISQRRIMAASLAIGSLASGLTLQEAQENPKEFILYDPAPFNRFIHAAIAGVLMYILLSILSLTVAAIAKFTGSMKRTREATDKRKNSTTNRYVRF